MQTRRDINEGLYNELNYYKENTYVDSGDGGKLKLSIRGNSQDPYDLIDKVTTIVNRISPGTVSSPDQNALIPGINDLLDSIYSETMIETRSGSSQSWRTVYGGQIRFIGNKTPEAIHQLEGVQDVTPSPDDDIEWILDVTGINYDDLYPIHEGYRQVANIMDLPEYGGLYHGRSMPGRSYTPPPGEINRVTSFLLQRNPAGLDKKVLTKPGTHRGTPKKIIKSVNSERNIVLTQGRK
jgi:hypothetical protein